MMDWILNVQTATASNKESQLRNKAGISVIQPFRRKRLAGDEVLEKISVEVPRTNTDTVDGSRLSHRYIWVILKATLLHN